MRLPRVRFTVRRMMVAMSVVAVSLGTERAARRSADFRELADFHAARLKKLAFLRQHEGVRYGSFSFLPPPEVLRRYDAETAPLHAQCVSYHNRLMRKYRRAMWLPWLAVDPDPPSPYPEPWDHP
jgi:hypothetical protein